MLYKETKVEKVNCTNEMFKTLSSSRRHHENIIYIYNLLSIFLYLYFFDL